MDAGKSKPGFDPVEMSRRGKIGALVTHSRHNPTETTAAARKAFLARFEREVDPDGVLTPEELQRRVCYARRAHFARLARLSALARQRSTAEASQPDATGLGGAS